jgi:hypothetical protein
MAKCPLSYVRTHDPKTCQSATCQQARDMWTLLWTVLTGLLGVSVLSYLLR